VHHFPNDKPQTELIQILTADVSDLRCRIDPALHCIVNGAYKTPGGYAVYLAESLTRKYYDYYDDRGVFQKREPADYTLIPVENSTEVWRANHDEERIFLLH
jgi:hypothetical protein